MTMNWILCKVLGHKWQVIPPEIREACAGLTSNTECNIECERCQRREWDLHVAVKEAREE